MFHVLRLMNLRLVRKKIKSVKNVKKITRAMQLISAVKMKKAVQIEVEGRPYRDGLSSIVHALMDKIDPSLSPLLQPPKTQATRDLVIYISANKGLCGSFHVNLLKYILKHIRLEDTDFVTLGSRGARNISRFDRDIISDYSSGSPTTKVSAVFGQAIEAYLQGKYRSIKLIYTRYISLSKSEIALETLLPILTPDSTTSPVDRKEYSVEPSPADLIDALLRSVVEERIRGAILSSEAVEHSMRMMAMKGATDNATDVIYDLTLVGNKLRQSKITGELLDMITAKESVESN